jgi:hypothetical protein
MLAEFPALVSDVASLGMTGLLFVMWWHERLERQRAALLQRDAQSVAEVVSAANARLLDVLQANTAALTSLRDELHSQRQAAGEWLTQVTRQLDEIERQTE